MTKTFCFKRKIRNNFLLVFEKFSIFIENKWLIFVNKDEKTLKMKDQV